VVGEVGEVTRVEGEQRSSLSMQQAVIQLS
jgi:hypothetical protein